MGDLGGKGGAKSIVWLIRGALTFHKTVKLLFFPLHLLPCALKTGVGGTA